MVKNPSITFSLYRSLYRIARNFDRSPASKVFLRRKPRIHYEFAAEMYYDQMLMLLFGKKQYVTTTESMPSFVKVLNTQFRTKSIDFDDEDRLDVGFALYRNFSAIWQSFITITTESQSSLTLDVNNQRERESSEASKLPFEEMANPSAGLVLVSHPLLDFVGMYHHRSVILLLSCTEKHIYGVRINRRTTWSMKEAVLNFPHTIFDYFESSLVYQGGPVRRLEALHSIPMIGREPISFCQHEQYYDSFDLEKAKLHFDQYPEDVHRCMMIVGSFIWDPKILEKEIQQGKWILGQTHPDQLLNMILHRPQIPLEGEPRKDSSLSEHIEDEARSSESSIRRKKRTEAAALPSKRSEVDIYTLLLQSMGEKYQPLLHLPPQQKDRKEIPNCDWR